MRTSRLLALAALAAASGCKSSLTVTVSQYQGELILSPESQIARIEGIARATFASLASGLTEGYLLYERLELATFDGKRVRPEKLEALRELDRLAIELVVNLLPEAQAENFEKVIKEARKVEEKASGDLLEGRQRALEAEIRKAAHFVLYGDTDQSLRPGAPSPRQAVLQQRYEAAQRCARFAELMHAMERSIELIDPLMLGYIDAEYFGLKSNTDWSDPGHLYARALGAPSKGSSSKRHGPGTVLDAETMQPKPADTGSARDVRRYYELLLDIWTTLHENYSRISGLANFILKRPVVAPTKVEVPAAAVDYRSNNWRALLEAESAVLATLRDEVAPDGEDDLPPAVPEGAGAAVERVKAVRRQLEELQSAYLNIDSTGAYLALQQVYDEIVAQQRPGEGGNPWQEVTRVEVQAGANADYVVMRDHLGNWQVKATRNDATELVNAVYGSALGAIELATQSGSVTANLREAYRTHIERVRAGSGSAHPFALRGLIDNLREDYEADLSAIDESTASKEEKAAARLARHRAYAGILGEIETALVEEGAGG